MWLHKEKHSGRCQETYDTAKEKPVIRASICTGEKTAGFQDIVTGKFREIMVIRDDKDFREFLDTYGIREDQVRKIW